MTFARYAHLKELDTRPWLVAVFVSWRMALLEYLFQVPANRIGYTALSLPHLKVMPEVITLVVFVPFAVLYMKQPIKVGFPMGGAVPAWCGLFCISIVRMVSDLTRSRTALQAPA